MKSNGQVGIQIPSRYPAWVSSTEFPNTRLSIHSGPGPVPDPNAVQAKSLYSPPPKFRIAQCAFPKISLDAR